MPKEQLVAKDGNINFAKANEQAFNDGANIRIDELKRLDLEDEPKKQGKGVVEYVAGVDLPGIENREIAIKIDKGWGIPANEVKGNWIVEDEDGLVEKKVDKNWEDDLPKEQEEVQWNKPVRIGEVLPYMEKEEPRFPKKKNKQPMFVYIKVDYDNRILGFTTHRNDVEAPTYVANLNDELLEDAIINGFNALGLPIIVEKY